MGVPGFLTFVKRCNFVRPFKLRNTTLLIDSNIIQWHFKRIVKQYRGDKLGSNMIQFGNYWTEFFDSLDRCKVKPIIVYDGTHTPDEIGDVSSKHRHMMQSCEKRLNKLRRFQFNLHDECMPELAHNIFRSILHERKYEIVQCYYETYPVLATLAEQYDCPVLSNHSDFLLYKLEQPFIWNDWFDPIIPNDQSNSELECRALYHKDLCDQFSVPHEHNNLLTLLYVISRPDFAAEYQDILGRSIDILANPGMRKRGVPRGPGWDNRLRWQTSIGWVTQQCSRDPSISVPQLGELLASRTDDSFRRKNFLNEFNILCTSYTTYIRLQSQLSGVLSANRLCTAMTLGTSTASFWLPIALLQRHHYRPTIEYMRTLRCSHSMMDKAKKLALAFMFTADQVQRYRYNNSRTPPCSPSKSPPMRPRNESLRSKAETRSEVFYRIFEDIGCRALNPSQPNELDLNQIDNSTFRQQIMNYVFMHGTSIDRWRQVELTLASAYFNRWFSEQVLTVFACIRAMLQDSIVGDEHFRTVVNHSKLSLVKAIWNSFLFYGKTQGYLHENLLNDEMIGDIRVMYALVDKSNWQHYAKYASEKDTDENLDYFSKIKHFNELLNATMSTYMELSGFLDIPLCKLEPHKYYNACLIFNLTNVCLGREQTKYGRSMLPVPQSIIDLFD